MSWGWQVLSFRLGESGAPWLGVVGVFKALGAEAQREKTFFWNQPLDPANPWLPGLLVPLGVSTLLPVPLLPHAWP